MLSDDRPLLLPPPPRNLFRQASLFMDFDGTLVEIVERPDAVVVDAALISLLANLRLAFEDRLAIVSGRSLAQLDTMLGPLAEALALSGSHGNEHRWRGVTAHPVRPAALDAAVDALTDFAAAHPGALVEIKSYSVALHYRQAPSIGAPAQAIAARLAAEHELSLECGKMVVELRVAGGDKGVAVRRLMARPPMAGTLPLFLGDDLTDEAGFEAARALGGMGILVGEPRSTAAEFGLPDVAAARAWLAGLAQ
jgi:trehalose 6-phosphate phosphatase